MLQNMTPTIYIVDDDTAVLDSLAMLLTAQGMHTVAHPNAMEFMAHYQGGDIGCLVLDIRMPQVTGLALQEQLQEAGIDIPIVFITGHGDIEQCRRAFQTGAIDFLTKPIDQNRLVESLRKGIRLSIQQHQKDEETQEVRGKLARISGREREVLELVADGHSSKEIARRLELSPRTIEVHRANLCNKLGVDSLADLVRFYLKALEATGKKRIEDSSESA